jgi:RimJ/RimL family protein N-acetyltransferase
MRDLERWTPPARPGAMTLEGRWARLGPLGPEHADPLHARFAAEDAIWAHLPYGPFADAAAYRAWVAAAAGRDDPRFFAIWARGDPDPGGVASLMRIDPANGVIEVGHLCLSPALRRSTPASEAIFLLADWVFATGYRRFEWKCDARNGASRSAAARFGFAFEGVFRQAAIVKGRNRDTAWFAMVDRDWPALRAAHLRWLDPANFDARGRQRQGLGALTDATRRAAEAEHPRP